MPVQAPPPPSSDAVSGLLPAVPPPLATSAPPAATNGQGVHQAEAAGNGAAVTTTTTTTPAPAAAAPASNQDPQGQAAPAKPKKKKKKSRWEAPSWAVSAIVHVTILGMLILIPLGGEVRKAAAKINAAMVDTSASAEEMVKILADPTDASREFTSGDPTSAAASAAGSAAPSATPAIASRTTVSERSSLPEVNIVPQISGLSMLPSAPSRDLSGSGGVRGDVAFKTDSIGEALDQIAREILRHLSQHRLTVVWLFDESGSMKDDQQEVKSKFDRISSELKLNVDDEKRAANALLHAIVGFGNGIHFVQDKPTSNVDLIGQAIDRLPVDETGTESTLRAVSLVINRYGDNLKDRRLLIVMVTDESGDDGAAIEPARQLAISKKVPIYVIGRQSLFGYGTLHLEYRDPVTKDVYWPAIRRGPETADVEMLQYDGLHGRWDEQPSGFAPYELARLAKDTGGIYFLLPSEESLRRVKTREKGYSITVLKEYIPDYESRAAYMERRVRSELRRSMYEVIQATKDFGFDHHLPIEPAKLVVEAKQTMTLAAARLQMLMNIEKRLKALEKARDREPEKRWQADYDLMVAQTLAYQVKSYELQACLAAMIKAPPKPSIMPNKNLMVEWDIHHSKKKWAPEESTAKKYAEAERLLKGVIARHPKTPWADLAQDELDRGMSVDYTEWRHDPRYDERAKLVPKY